MSGERRAYIAITLFEFVSPDPAAEELYREDTTLVYGRSEAEAREEAERWGREQEGVDETTGTVVVGPHFLQVVDVAPVLDDDLAGTADLYSRHFRDLTAYRRWEPLLDGEPL
ncbi:MAG: hypothetical protein QOE59_2539 [Actinomycetota bacterium]|jgi:hypothetical protein|nr:hypothetical protein [Actinomycetota bacterium]